MVSEAVLEKAVELSENKPEHRKIRHGKGGHDLKYSPYELNRWQKYGNDRLYFRDADGYLDVETGAVEGDTPICNVTVENIGGDVWTYYYMVERDIDYEGEKLVAAIKR